jgi:hypothetical protein
MPIDTARALDRVNELIGLCERAQARYDRDHENYYRDPEYEEMRAQIIGLLPLIRSIAEEAYPRVLSDFVEHNAMYTFPWDIVQLRSIELRGALSNAEEAAAIVGPAGPRLAAASLHAWVWNAAVDLWGGAHYRNAVLDAYTKVETMTKAKTDRDESGKALWSEVFSLNAPSPDRHRLRFPNLTEGTDRYRSAHEGAMQLGMACAQGIRNWAAHSSDGADEQVALEYLATLSVLARWVDQSLVR